MEKASEAPPALPEIPSSADYDSISDASYVRSTRLPNTPHSIDTVDAELTDSMMRIEDGRYVTYQPSAGALKALLKSKKYRYPSSNHSLIESSNLSSQSPGPGARTRHVDRYPTWSNDSVMPIPISREEIWTIIQDLTHKFGFQQSSAQNIYDHMLIMLDSRASRMTPTQALTTLHAEYIGGYNANYRKWYFAAQLDLDDDVGDRHNNRANGKNKKKKPKKESGISTSDEKIEIPIDSSLEHAELRWKQKMNTLSHQERVQQLALYLLIWGEAAVIRFTPECLCYIYKLAQDYFVSDACQRGEGVPEFTFLNNVISPLYDYIRDESYELIKGTYVKREKDHDSTIGYDDINQLFWYPESIERIVLKDKTKLHDIPFNERYLHLQDVNWKKSFRKTYKETRTWGHVFVNFNRIWIMHICMFWLYITYNANFMYMTAKEIKAGNTAKQWSMAGLCGAIATLLMIIGTIAEWCYVPLTRRNNGVLTRRFFMLLLLFFANVGPAVFVMFINFNQTISTLVAIVQFFLGIITTIVFAIIPPSRLFVKNKKKDENDDTRKSLASQTFTASFPTLSYKDRCTSVALWVGVFLCKYIESYFVLSLSFKDPLYVMTTMKITGCVKGTISTMICQYLPKVTLVMMFILNLVLFFLDTYLWYIIWNTIFSVAGSFYLGISIWTPWRNIFTRLPKRLYAKLLTTIDMDIKLKPKVLCSQIWNAIILSMYREHLLNVDHVQKLLYQQASNVQHLIEIDPNPWPPNWLISEQWLQVQRESDGKHTLRTPTFFIFQEDTNFKTEFYPEDGEADRRITFFAQSMSTPMPEPVSVENMPTFTVFTPHYSEKILLSLREIIREEDHNTRITLLEYLKQLHSAEWENFVKDTKVFAEESSLFAGDHSNLSFTNMNAMDISEKIIDAQMEKGKIDDVPFYGIGFKTASPEYILRTRIWASLRAQTLYRTVSGFMNYHTALKLLYRIENQDAFSEKMSEHDMEADLDAMARRKFKFLVSMQRYVKFSREELESVEFLFEAYPDLQIAYIDEVPSAEEGAQPEYWSALIDGRCERLENGRRKPIYRVKLPGNPILGDGKSDNQNHAIIFYRGEYLQLIDANQDNYLEECLKVRNVLGEFEEYVPAPSSPYSAQHEPVAIVGAREHIFSQNIGLLGDVAAGKEQTFGTLSQRNISKIGGKLHYGHPDFLNAIFMTTRGGVSKAQKGLHLNEDIYAGMSAFTRGGRIKHTEYYQCGKGRDLGFGSVLNFTTKIGSGMGEQMLSREYYYIGTQLPIDRFLTFFYSLPGFHINNIFIMWSVQIFMIVLILLGSMMSSVTLCDYNPFALITDPTTPAGCYNLTPVLEWVQRCVLSILSVFIIAFLPLFFQELTEKGLLSSVSRLLKHVFSLSPLFEVFMTQIYTNSLLQNISFGGAKYIATGRGFATSRISFSLLYSRFAGPSVYLGGRIFIFLLYASVAIWQGEYAYFWITAAALLLSPFFFNPHQFSFTDFMVDYREFLRWLSRGNSKPHSNSWIAYTRSARTRLTGFKRRTLEDQSANLAGDSPRAKFSNIFWSEIMMPFIQALLCMAAYAFVKSSPAEQSNTKVPHSNTSGLMRVGIVAFGPIALNAGAVAGCCVIGFIIFYEVMVVLENFNFQHALLGLIAAMSLQRWFLRLLTVVCLTREMQHDGANRAWWTGAWYNKGLGWHAVTQPGREFVCKIVEMSLFATDFLLGHLILITLSLFTLIPYVDWWHSTLLFWLRPSNQLSAPLYSVKQRRERKSISIRYGILFLVVALGMLLLIAAPVLVGPMLKFGLPRFVVTL
ncbi:hypothetical protein BZG36_03818 [Bifiguratus adelaidae]|uniref:1,3-beta-glucan synthase n=1 Tax=Bifiguratus adelaidae TaxID=1938954 RepID=A0A261XZQ5_9FUNG|nr:hypothetical protein BZG36_03818 [Bifiguratus adelaidae]